MMITIFKFAGLPSLKAAAPFRRRTAQSGLWRRVTVTARPLRIVLPGGSGHVGQILARHFQQAGHHVTVLTRSPYTAPWQTVHWDGDNPGTWVETLEGADVCINLAGRSVNCRYNQKHRREIYDSRIGTTGCSAASLPRLPTPPRVWLNMSTATIYRHALDGRWMNSPASWAAES